MDRVEILEFAANIKTIGVISDTHIPSRATFIPEAVLNALAGSGLILCAGDLVEPEVLSALGRLAPVVAVAGNMDSYALKKCLGRLKLVRLGPLSIALLHGDQAGRRVNYERLLAPFAPLKPACLVFGHLHQAHNKRVCGILYFNPGSPSDPRRGHQASVGRLTIEEGEIKGEIIYL